MNRYRVLSLSALQIASIVAICNALTIVSWTAFHFFSGSIVRNICIIFYAWIPLVAAVLSLLFSRKLGFILMSGYFAIASTYFLARNIYPNLGIGINQLFFSMDGFQLVVLLLISVAFSLYKKADQDRLSE